MLLRSDPPVGAWHLRPPPSLRAMLVTLGGSAARRLPLHPSSCRMLGAYDALPLCVLCLSQVEALLESAYTSFSFNAFRLNEATQGHPLSTLGYFLLHKTGLISRSVCKAGPQSTCTGGNPCSSALPSSETRPSLRLTLHGLQMQYSPACALINFLCSAAHCQYHLGTQN